VRICPEQIECVNRGVVAEDARPYVRPIPEVFSPSEFYGIVQQSHFSLARLDRTS